MNRPEYPRPDFARPHWLNLNGAWDFQLASEPWTTIQVPFVFQSAASGIGHNRMCDDMTYRRTFTLPSDWAEKRVLLHFGAVDYRAKVLVNGQIAGSHEGGSAPFALDITDLLGEGDQTLEVQVNDPCTDEEIPRGKQYWLPEPASIWYTRSSGIWQTVWLEAVESCRLSELWFTPDIDAGTVCVEYAVEGFQPGAQLSLAFSMKGEAVTDLSTTLHQNRGKITVDLFGNHIFRTAVHNPGYCWTPESPSLFDVTATLTAGDRTDQVETYFGMRKIEVKDGMVWLNNRPYYQRLVLDQGYWPDTLMTAPSDDALRRDIELSKELGFNGCRKHQKAEDPRFYYWADRLGFLVWAEIPSCPSYSRNAARRVMAEWTEMVARDYNHPSIVCWVVLNESWGVPGIRTDSMQQAHSLALYHNIKSLDATRLVVNNDGWEMTHTDICAVHNYSHGPKDDPAAHKTYADSLATKSALLSSTPAHRPLYADGFAYRGEPVLLTEFGGISFRTTSSVVSQGADWGYTSIDNEEEFLSEYRRMLGAIGASRILYGYCYTQLTDVEQEVNGLLTYDRRPKADMVQIAAINKSAEKVWVIPEA